MGPARKATLVNFGLRVAYGAGMLVVPARIGRSWTGRPRTGAQQDIPLRGIGGREVALHTAGLTALLGGAPLRPWLLASLGGDLTDLASSVAQRKQLPDGGLRAVLLTGGGSALFTLALLAASAED